MQAVIAILGAVADARVRGVEWRRVRAAAGLGELLGRMCGAQTDGNTRSVQRALAAVVPDMYQIHRPLPAVSHPRHNRPRPKVGLPVELLPPVRVNLSR